MSQSPSAPTFLEAMIQEADAYLSMASIEACVEKGVSLHNIPTQPLYMAIKALPAEQAAPYLAKLSSDQRTLLLDLDLWEKDELSVGEFEYWVRTYALAENDTVRCEFAAGPEFGLYLKGRLNIWTFDQENPLYPQHDNYFLTEDSLLLFEYDEEFDLVEEVKLLIRDLYSTMGSEKAYIHLFKYVSESAFSLMEEEYRFKKGRLADAGMIDYYDALEIDNPFPSLSAMENFIHQKTDTGITPEIGDFSKQQRPDRTTLSAYRKFEKSIQRELGKLTDTRRRDFLQFNFIRLVNASVVLKSGLKEGPIALERVGKRTHGLLQLGYDYLKTQLSGEIQCIFEHFDFCQIYKMGHTLISLSQRKIKRALARTELQNGLQSDEAFLGTKLNNLLDSSFDELETVTSYNQWKKSHQESERLEKILPFADELYREIAKLKGQNKLKDHFFLNYDVEQLDFEALILSNFAHFFLGHYQQEKHTEKLGVTLEEYKHFVAQLPSNPLEEIREFQHSFGFKDIPGFTEYMQDLLTEHLKGYDFKTLDEQEFRYVGGPIINNHF